MVGIQGQITKQKRSVLKMQRKYGAREDVLNRGAWVER